MSREVAKMLVPLVLGALIGPSGLDLVHIPLGSTGAQLLFTVGVSAILFHGGLNVSLGIMRGVAVSLALLAGPGVIVTAAVTGLAAHLAFDFSWSESLLMGAVLAPTDPAMLIPLFLGSRLRAKLSHTIVAESALNDLTGAILALTLAGVVAGNFSADLPISAGAYLVAFAAGVAVGSYEHRMTASAQVSSDVATLLVFLVVGLNLPFGTVGDELVPALAVLATLLFVARPLTVLACVLPDRAARWTRPELLFLCWTRETGVVPAALVGVLAGLGAPDADVFASVVALAIVVTLAAQALPASRLARMLGLLETSALSTGSSSTGGG